MLIIALSVTSCAAPRKAVSERTAQEVVNTTTAQTDSLLIERAVAAVMARLTTERTELTTERDEAMERVTEIFDTSLPADSLTGQPPLQQRITVRRARHAKEEEKSERTEKEAATTADTLSVRAGAQAESAATSEKQEAEASREERKSNAGQTMAAILGWLSIIAFAGVLLLVAARWIINRLNNH